MNELFKANAAKILSCYSNAEDILEKGGKSFPIGSKDKSGKNVKTANGWKPVSTHAHLVKDEHGNDKNNEQRLKDRLADYLKNSGGYGAFKDFKVKNKLADGTIVVNATVSGGKATFAIDESGKVLLSEIENNEKNSDKDKKEDSESIEDIKKKENEKLPESKDSTIHCLKAGTVNAKNIKDNEIVQAWGENTSYFLVNDKYIIAGSGEPKEYIGKNMEMRLVDDGNRTTKFENSHIKYPGADRWSVNPNVIKRKVTQFASNIDDFQKMLPKGTNFNMYAMK